MLRPYQGIAPRIHDSCYIDESAQIIGDVEIGENSSVWMNAVIRGDVFAIRIGKNSNVQDCSVLHGMRHKYGVTMGDWVTVGHSVTLHGCTIGDRCLIGMGSIVMDAAVVESDVLLGAGSLVSPGKRLESGFLYRGSPAQKVRALTDAEREMLLYSAQHYVRMKDRYLAGG